MLSIIIPLYNGDRYIRETINYIQASEYKNLEIIIVNDGSNDNSEQIVQELQKADKRIVIYNKVNGGVVSARNYGASKAKGNYLCFVDQDDIVKPCMYSKLIAALEENQSDMAMCSSGRSIEGKASGYDYQKDALYENADIHKYLLYPILFNGFDVPVEIGEGNHYPHIWTCVFRTKFWRENDIQFRAYINFEDDLLVKIETLSKARKVSTISDIGYLWRVNLESETYAHHFVDMIGEKQEQSYQDLKRSLEECDTDEKILRLFKQVIYCKQYVDAIHYLSSPDVKKNKEFIKNYYQENIYSRDFDEVIKGRKYLKKGRIKLGILLPLLAKKRTMLSYRAELFLDMVLIGTLHSQVLTKFERSIKKKSR